jgi:multiple sugar transport system substrate-binding protein
MMDPGRRAWLARAAALAVPSGVTGCGSDPARLSFWAMGREGEVAVELLAGFERENPGVRLQIEQLPWSAAHEKLLTAFAGDALPDLAQVGNTWLPEMAALNALEPLSSWLESKTAPRAADHFDGIWQTNVIGGEVVGVPWYVDTRLLFYRRDLLGRAGFDHPPADWSEWRRMLAALHGGEVPTPLLLPVNEFEPLLALALQQNDSLLKDGGRRGNFSSAGFGRALDFYLEAFRRGWAPPLSHNQVANVAQEFGRGRFAFYITGPWNIGEFRRRLPPELQSAWTTAPLPGPNGPGASIAGGASLVLFRRSRRKAMAWRLVEYLCRPAVQQQFYYLTGNLPPRRDSWNAAPLATDEQAQAFRRQLERVVPTPAVPEWERIAQEMQLAAARLVNGDGEPAAACAALDVQVDAILAKRRWMLDRAAARPA